MDCDHADCRAEEGSSSTGFLPMGLAVALFLMGLFVLGFVPSSGCSDSAVAAEEAPAP